MLEIGIPMTAGEIASWRLAHGDFVAAVWEAIEDILGRLLELNKMRSSL